MDTRQERAKNKIRADVKSHIKAKAEYQKSSSNRATYDKDVEKKVTVSSPITGATIAEDQQVENGQNDAEPATEDVSAASLSDEANTARSQEAGEGGGKKRSYSGSIAGNKEEKSLPSKKPRTSGGGSKDALEAGESDTSLAANAGGGNDDGCVSGTTSADDGNGQDAPDAAEDGDQTTSGKWSELGNTSPTELDSPSGMLQTPIVPHKVLMQCIERVLCDWKQYDRYEFAEMVRKLFALDSKNCVPSLTHLSNLIFQSSDLFKVIPARPEMLQNPDYIQEALRAYCIRLDRMILSPRVDRGTATDPRTGEVVVMVYRQFMPYAEGRYGGSPSFKVTVRFICELTLDYIKLVGGWPNTGIEATTAARTAAIEAVIASAANAATTKDLHSVVQAAPDSSDGTDTTKKELLESEYADDELAMNQLVEASFPAAVQDTSGNSAGHHLAGATLGQGGGARDSDLSMFEAITTGISVANTSTITAEGRAEDFVREDSGVAAQGSGGCGSSIDVHAGARASDDSVGGDPKKNEEKAAGIPATDSAVGSANGASAATGMEDGEQDGEQDIIDIAPDEDFYSDGHSQVVKVAKPLNLDDGNTSFEDIYEE